MSSVGRAGGCREEAYLEPSCAPDRHEWLIARKRPASPALLKLWPISETADLKALHKVGVKVDGGRGDRDHHGQGAAPAMEHRGEAADCCREPRARRVCHRGGGSARCLSEPGFRLAPAGS